MILWHQGRNAICVFYCYDFINNVEVASLEMPSSSCFTLFVQEMGFMTTHSSTFDNLDVCMIVMNVVLILSSVLRPYDNQQLFYLHSTPDLCSYLLFPVNFSQFNFFGHSKR